MGSKVDAPGLFGMGVVMVGWGGWCVSVCVHSRSGFEWRESQGEVTRFLSRRGSLVEGGVGSQAGDRPGEGQVAESEWERWRRSYLTQEEFFENVEIQPFLLPTRNMYSE